MKGLTIRQPWADAIVQPSDNPKRIENRARQTHYRGRLLIHAGLAGDRQAVLDGILPGPDVRGAVIAMAELVGCHQATGGCCAPWGFADVWHWELANVRALPVPVAAKGALGLWTPTAELLATIEAQRDGRGPVSGFPIAHFGCRRELIARMAAMDTEVIVSELPPLVSNAFVTDPFTCPHGVVYWLEPTSEQRAIWARDEID